MGKSAKPLAFFVLGIVLSGCAVLQRVAETLSEHGLSAAKMTSIERRLARFLANNRILVPRIWQLFVAQVCAPLRGQKRYARAGQYALSRRFEHVLCVLAGPFTG